MDNRERKQKIRYCIEMLEHLKDELDEAVDGTVEKQHFHAYGRYGLDMMLGNGNPYDSSLYDLFKTFNGGQDE